MIKFGTSLAGGSTHGKMLKTMLDNGKMKKYMEKKLKNENCLVY